MYRKTPTYLKETASYYNSDQIYSHLVENHAQSKDVSCLHNVFGSFGHFGGAVRRSSLEGPGFACGAKSVYSVLAETKIYNDAIPILLANDVCWFEITVDDILLKTAETELTKCTLAGSPCIRTPQFYSNSFWECSAIRT
jgi:hypothetical protein